jgi:hypothetical protein
VWLLKIINGRVVKKLADILGNKGKSCKKNVWLNFPEKICCDRFWDRIGDVSAMKKIIECIIFLQNISRQSAFSPLV